MKRHRESPLVTRGDADRPSAKLERRGDTIVLSESCLSTASGVCADYADLSRDIRKTMQYIQQKQKRGESRTEILAEIKRDFPDSILVGDETHPGYATDADLAGLISNPGQTPSKVAVDLIAERSGLTPATVLTYTKRRKSA